MILCTEAYLGTNVNTYRENILWNARNNIQTGPKRAKKKC